MRDMIKDAGSGEAACSYYDSGFWRGCPFLLRDALVGKTAIGKVIFRKKFLKRPWSPSSLSIQERRRQ